MSFKKYVFFFCGQLGMMLLARFFFQWILDFSSREIGSNQNIPVLLFSPVAVGLTLLGFRVFDAVTDPLAGILSDRHVANGKERRTLLLWWLLPPALGLILCFLPGAEMSVSLRWIILFSGMLIFFMGYTFYAIPYWSLVEDYSQGNETDRRRLSNLLGAGLMLATALGFIVTPFLVSAFGFLYASMLVAGVSAILMLMPYFAAPARTAKEPKKESSPLNAQRILHALKDKNFGSVCILYVGSQMSLTVMTSAAPFVASVLLGGTEKDVATLMGPLLLFAMLTFFFVPKISSKFSWQTTTLTATLGLLFVYCFGVLIGSPLLPDPKVSAICIFALAGPFIAILLGVEGEAITDSARAHSPDSVSSYFGVFNLLVKAANGLAIFLMGFLVELARGPNGGLAVRGMLALSLGTLLAGLFLFWLSKRSLRRE